MAIEFLCERCGHRFELDESLAGQRGHCKACGQEMTVPSAGFRLEPIPDPPADREAARLQAAAGSASGPKASANKVKLAPIDEEPQPGGIPEEYLADRTPYEVDRDFVPPPSAAPPSSIPVLMEARSGWRHSVRKLQAALAGFEDVIYLILMGFWLVGAIAFLFELKPLTWAMLGTLVVCSVLLMLLGALDLFINPFKESLRHGLAFVLLPPYAIYYIGTRWKQMKRPFRKAVGAFLPLIILLILALFGRPIRGWFLHPRPKKDEQQVSRIEAWSDLPAAPILASSSRP